MTSWQQQGPRRTVILFTRATSHFERSLLKALACLNVLCGMHTRQHTDYTLTDALITYATKQLPAGVGLPGTDNEQSRLEQMIL